MIRRETQRDLPKHSRKLVPFHSSRMLDRYKSVCRSMLP
jgi:hypothetical protein